MRERKEGGRERVRDREMNLPKKSFRLFGFLVCALDHYIILLLLRNLWVFKL